MTIGLPEHYKNSLSSTSCDAARALKADYGSSDYNRTAGPFALARRQGSFSGHLGARMENLKPQISLHSNSFTIVMFEKGWRQLQVLP
jgi:hypothetical protein